MSIDREEIKRRNASNPRKPLSSDKNVERSPSGNRVFGREIRLVDTPRVSVIVSGLVLAAIRLERVFRGVQTDRETGNILSERGARRSAVRTEDH